MAKLLVVALSLTALCDGLAQAPLSITPELTISASREGLDRPYSLVVTPDGGVAVADNANLMISMYDSGGRRLARVGGFGRGPGEFQRFNEQVHGTIGDSVWFFDPTQMRTVTFTSRGKHVRTAMAPTTAVLAAGSEKEVRVYPRAFLTDGSTIVLFSGRARSANARDPEALTFGVMSTSSRITRLLGSVLVPQTSVTATSSSSVVVPFMFSPKALTSVDGRFALLVSANKARDVSDTVRVTVVRSTGDTAYTWKQVLPRKRIPDSTFDRAMEGQLKSARRAGTEAQLRSELFRLMPRSYPAVSNAFVTRDGSTWLGLHPGGAGSWFDIPTPTRYLVISPNGRSQGIVTVPKDVTLIDAIGDRVWGFAEDADGFRDIVRFKIHR